MVNPPATDQERSSLQIPSERLLTPSLLVPNWQEALPSDSPFWLGIVPFLLHGVSGETEGGPLPSLILYLPMLFEAVFCIRSLYWEKQEPTSSLWQTFMICPVSWLQHLSLFIWISHTACLSRKPQARSCLIDFAFAVPSACGTVPWICLTLLKCHLFERPFPDDPM